MNNILVSHTKGAVEKIIQAIENENKPILFFRYYSSFAMDEKLFAEEMNDKMGPCFVRNFVYRNDVMYDICTPILTWIKELYRQYYSTITVEEFLDKCDVYPLHRSFLATFFENGLGKRDEDPIINEVAYENIMFYKSVVNMLDFISNEHTVAFLLQRIHLGQLSICKFLHEIVKGKKCKKLIIIASYNEVIDVPEYMQENWSKLVELVDREGYVSEWDVYQAENEIGVNTSFTPEDASVKEYYRILQNLVNGLEIEQAAYYLNLISYMRDFNYSYVNDKIKIRLLLLSTYVNLFRGKYKRAIQLCDEFRKYDEYTNDLKLQFQYNKLVVIAKVYGGQRESAYRNVVRCNELAKRIEEEKYEIESHVLRCIVELDGWKDVTFRNSVISLAPDFEEKALKYNWKNHMAYIYFFGYIEYNTIRNVRLKEGAEAVLEYPYFKRGMELARELKNNQLILASWQKVLMISTSAGNIEASDYFVDRSLEIIRSENREREEALLYNGAGYYCVIRENYMSANHYFRNALEMFIKKDEPIMAAETIYDIAINAMDCGQYSVSAKCMNIILKIMKRLRNERIRVANKSKLIGMLAVSNIMLNKIYDAKVCLGRMENILSHILDAEVPCYDMWEDDVFLYYFVSAMILSRENKNAEAEKLLKKAEDIKKLMPTNQFYVYVLYIKEFANIYKKMQNKEKLDEILDSGIKYCEHMNFEKRRQRLIDFKNSKDSEDVFNDEIKDIFSERQIELLDGVVDKYNYKTTIEKKNKSMRFFEKWVGILNAENSSVDDMIDKAMKNFENEYNVDKLVYIEIDEDKPVVKYFDKSNPITGGQIKGIVKFFDEYRKNIVVNRFESDYHSYDELTELFGKNEVLSIMGIPIVNDGKLKSILVAVKTKHDNFTQQLVTFSKDDLEVFTATFKLILDAITRENIKIMLEKNSVTDILTGLYNRQGLKKAMTECVSQKKQMITVMYLDLDNFKYCNDNFGHEVGDEVLMLFAHILRMASGSGSIICRYGGDEFVIFLPGKEVIDGINASEAVFREIEDRKGFVKEISKAYGSDIEIKPENRITCSVGIASDLCVNMDDIRSLLMKADEALYDVKRTTKNNYKVWN